MKRRRKRKEGWEKQVVLAITPILLFVFFFLSSFSLRALRALRGLFLLSFPRNDAKDSFFVAILSRR
jgi:hypothetical protein